MNNYFEGFLKSKIESLLSGRSLKSISKASGLLSRLYRDRKSSSELYSLSSEDQRLAYVCTRLPATYAAICRTLKELLLRSGGEKISSLLDIGAGPGSVLMAVMEVCLPIFKATMIEKEPGFIALGKFFTEDFNCVEQNWVAQDITKEWSCQPHDLVVASYALNEMNERDRLKIVEKLWEVANKFLVIIEPGTKSGFGFLKQLRQSLIEKGAHLIAPCPHSGSCPLPEGDWCHFAARVERSSLHRHAKQATLNYEDEKFSYLIFSKSPFETCQSRVLRRPFKGQGFVQLSLCSKQGVALETVTRKNNTVSPEKLSGVMNLILVDY